MNSNIFNNSIFSESTESLQNYMHSKGHTAFRYKQLKEWLFQKRVFELDQMSNLPKNLKADLSHDYNWSLPEIIERVDSEDGASKLLFSGPKNQVFESVILRYENRTSLCVSSQVGCKLACSFCQTGKLGFFRHLSSDEIIAQFIQAQKITALEGRNISHIVFMGMGEPLDNYDAVVKACNIFIDKEFGFGLSHRHVTVSTSGIVPKMYQLAQDTRASLAVSLHAADDKLRTMLMPINRKYSLAELKTAILNHQKVTGKKTTIEYILIDSQNCDLLHAKQLVKFLHGLRVKVNLIPFNAHPGLSLKRPDDVTIRNFQKHLADRSLPAPVRYSKGLDASAACGQLAAKRITGIHNIPERKFVINSSSVEMTL